MTAYTSPRSHRFARSIERIEAVTPDAPLVERDETTFWTERYSDGDVNMIDAERTVTIALEDEGNDERTYRLTIRAETFDGQPVAHMSRTDAGLLPADAVRILEREYFTL